MYVQIILSIFLVAIGVYVYNNVVFFLVVIKNTCRLCITLRRELFLLSIFVTIFGSSFYFD